MDFGVSMEPIKTRFKFSDFDQSKAKLISMDGEVIEFADTTLVEKYKDQVAELLDLFSYDYDEVLITDESKISDFGKKNINKKKLEKFKKKYKFSFTNADTLSKIAERMYNYRPF
jgi:hypothetical protein